MEIGKERLFLLYIRHFLLALFFPSLILVKLLVHLYLYDILHLLASHKLVPLLKGKFANCVDCSSFRAFTNIRKLIPNSDNRFRLLLGCLIVYHFLFIPLRSQFSIDKTRTRNSCIERVTFYIKESEQHIKTR